MWIILLLIWVQQRHFMDKRFGEISTMIHTKSWCNYTTSQDYKHNYNIKQNDRCLHKPLLNRCPFHKIFRSTNFYNCPSHTKTISRFLQPDLIVVTWIDKNVFIFLKSRYRHDIGVGKEKITYWDVSQNLV